MVCLEEKETVEIICSSNCRYNLCVDCNKKIDKCVICKKKDSH